MSARLSPSWPREKAIETSIEATSFAHKNGLEVVFLPVDFSRAELKWALDLIERVGKEGHMDPPSLRFGGASPHATPLNIMRAPVTYVTRHQPAGGLGSRLVQPLRPIRFCPQPA